MNVRHPMGVLQGVLDSFSIKNIFYDKMDLRRFYFHVTICDLVLRKDIERTVKLFLFFLRSWYLI